MEGEEYRGAGNGEVVFRSHWWRKALKLSHSAPGSAPRFRPGEAPGSKRGCRAEVKRSRKAVVELKAPMR